MQSDKLLTWVTRRNSGGRSRKKANTVDLSGALERRASGPPASRWIGLHDGGRRDRGHAWSLSFRPGLTEQRWLKAVDLMPGAAGDCAQRFNLCRERRDAGGVGARRQSGLGSGRHRVPAACRCKASFGDSLQEAVAERGKGDQGSQHRGALLHDGSAFGPGNSVAHDRWPERS